MAKKSIFAKSCQRIGCLFIVSLFMAPWAQADTLLIESVQSAHHRNLPVTGQLMTEVRSLWGEPITQHSAVGQPPITRWDFDGFSVYFEYDHVISSVLHDGAVVDAP